MKETKTVTLKIRWSKRSDIFNIFIYFDVGGRVWLSRQTLSVYRATTSRETLGRGVETRDRQEFDRSGDSTGRSNGRSVIIEGLRGDLGRSGDAAERILERAQLGRRFAGRPVGRSQRDRAASVGHVWTFTDKKCRHFVDPSGSGTRSFFRWHDSCSRT